MTDKEGEWVALVTRIEEAMCIVPFKPRQGDVITLLSMAVNGNQHMLRVEDLDHMVETLRADNERLRAALTEMLESFTEPEDDDNDIIRRARAALGKR